MKFKIVPKIEFYNYWFSGSYPLISFLSFNYEKYNSSFYLPYKRIVLIIFNFEIQITFYKDDVYI